jgi:energy-converting hydrogenase Eha subunit C
MKFLIMFLLEVDIIHLAANRTFLDVATAVTEVSSHLALWILLQTVVATLDRLVLHNLT